MERIFKLGLKGTKDLTIESGADWRDACWRAGWDPDKCEAEDITEALEEGKRNGTIYEFRATLERIREIEDMLRKQSAEPSPSPSPTGRGKG